jgi:hypothetical protein
MDRPQSAGATKEMMEKKKMQQPLPRVHESMENDRLQASVEKRKKCTHKKKLEDDASIAGSTEQTTPLTKHLPQLTLPPNFPPSYLAAAAAVPIPGAFNLRIRNTSLTRFILNTTTSPVV